MQILIDISEDDYNNIAPFLNGESIKSGFNLFKTLEIIKNGTPLPKGHGRLIDADALTSWMTEVDKSYRTIKVIAKCEVDKAPTIIEADKESDEGYANDWIGYNR